MQQVCNFNLNAFYGLYRVGDLLDLAERFGSAPWCTDDLRFLVPVVWGRVMSGFDPSFADIAGVVPESNGSSSNVDFGDGHFLR